MDFCKQLWTSLGMWGGELLYDLMSSGSAVWGQMQGHDTVLSSKISEVGCMSRNEIPLPWAACSSAWPNAFSPMSVCCIWQNCTLFQWPSQRYSLCKWGLDREFYALKILTLKKRKKPALDDYCSLDICSHSPCAHYSCSHRKDKFPDEAGAYKSSCCVRSSAFSRGCHLMLSGFCIFCFPNHIHFILLVSVWTCEAPEAVLQKHELFVQWGILSFVLVRSSLNMNIPDCWWM